MTKMELNGPVQIIEYKPQQIDVPLQSIRRYLGLARAQPDETIEGMIQGCLAEFLQAVQFKGGKCEDFNAKFQIAEAGVVYDYENSKAWRDLTVEIEKLNEKRKTIESALKLATPEVPFVDPTNGEKITECKKVYKTIVKTTINK